MTFKGPTFKYINCPDCCKRRSMKPVEYIATNKMEKVTLQNGQEFEYNVDSCAFCLEKQVRKAYKVTTVDDVKKVLKALQNEEPIPEGKSIEELL